MRLFPSPGGRVQEVEIAVRQGRDEAHELRIEGAPPAQAVGDDGATDGPPERHLSAARPEE
jgi:hypothetical protein